jgi:hypothetical protein
LTEALFLAAFAALPVLGIWVRAIPAVARLDLAGRLAAGAVAGALTLTLWMTFLSVVGIAWSVPVLLLPALVVCAPLLARRRKSARQARASRRAVAARIFAAAILGATAYAAATARATSTDLLLFWGTKAERFALARGIDTAFLADRSHELMHPDYPPLAPSLGAWSALVAGGFSWPGEVLSLPLFLFLATEVFGGFSRSRLPDAQSAELSAVLASLLCYGTLVSLSAGNAEPTLLMFESAALSALIFGGESSSSEIFAGIALGGAVLTKVEGLVFAGLVVASFAVLGRVRGRRLSAGIRLGALPAAAAAGWIAYCAAHGLLDTYVGRTVGPATLSHAGTILVAVAKAGRYDFLYVPWIGVALLWLTAPRRGKGVPAAATALGFLLFIAFLYAHGAADPSQWIAWSASRLLLTPLLCLFFAAAAASAPQPSSPRSETIAPARKEAGA